MKVKSDLLIELKPFLDILSRVEVFEKKIEFPKLQMVFLFFGLVVVLTTSLVSSVLYLTELPRLTILLFLNLLGVSSVITSIIIYFNK
ncbi:MAG: hypothetical protein ACW964_07895 [Candidatus Hodarchaeales archaeon]|jgi:hypothetical protein